MNTQPTLAIFGNISPYLSQSIVCEVKVQFPNIKLDKVQFSNMDMDTRTLH